MISILDLFDRDNILCPNWLSYLRLEEDWQDSVYSYENRAHIWSLETPLKNVQITFDGEEYNFKALDDNGEWVYLETINKECSIQY